MLNISRCQNSRGWRKSIALSVNRPTTEKEQVDDEEILHFAYNQNVKLFTRLPTVARYDLTLFLAWSCHRPIKNLFSPRDNCYAGFGINQLSPFFQANKDGAAAGLESPEPGASSLIND